MVELADASPTVVRAQRKYVDGEGTRRHLHGPIDKEKALMPSLSFLRAGIAPDSPCTMGSFMPM